MIRSLARLASPCGLACAALVAGTASPALAYYPDDHIWDREYQSAVEWAAPVPGKPVPWVGASAWRGQYAAAPEWWAAYQPAAWTAENQTGWYDWRIDPGAYTKAIPQAYMPMASTWTTYDANHPRAWDGTAWNVAWWNPAAGAMSNAGYHKAVFDSAQNPYSDTGKNNELAVAAAYGDLGRVKALVAAGADIHARDYEGYTPLTWAAQHGRRDVAEYLVGRYAQVNAVDRWGYTPLMWAVQQGHTDVAALLLSKGANPRVQTPYGVTPVVLAAYAAGGRSRGLVEDALAGRKVNYAAYMGGQAPAATAGYGARALAGQTAAAAAPAAAQPMAMMDQTMGLVKLGALGLDFNNDLKAYIAESSKGGLTNSFAAMTSPDMVMGKDLNLMFGKLAKDRDIKQVRADLDAIKPTVTPTSRFAGYVNSVDDTLKRMGY